MCYIGHKPEQMADSTSKQSRIPKPRSDARPSENILMERYSEEWISGQRAQSAKTV